MLVPNMKLVRLRPEAVLRSMASRWITASAAFSSAALLAYLNDYVVIRSE